MNLHLKTKFFKDNFCDESMENFMIFPCVPFVLYCIVLYMEKNLKLENKQASPSINSKNIVSERKQEGKFYLFLDFLEIFPQFFPQSLGRNFLHVANW